MAKLDDVRLMVRYDEDNVANSDEYDEIEEYDHYEVWSKGANRAFVPGDVVQRLLLDIRRGRVTHVPDAHGNWPAAGLTPDDPTKYPSPPQYRPLYAAWLAQWVTSPSAAAVAGEWAAQQLTRTTYPAADSAWAHLKQARQGATAAAAATTPAVPPARPGGKRPGQESGVDASRPKELRSLTNQLTHAEKAVANAVARVETLKAEIHALSDHPPRADGARARVAAAGGSRGSGGRIGPSSRNLPAMSLGGANRPLGWAADVDPSFAQSSRPPNNHTPSSLPAAAAAAAAAAAGAGELPAPGELVSAPRPWTAAVEGKAAAMPWLQYDPWKTLVERGAGNLTLTISKSTAGSVQDPSSSSKKLRGGSSRYYYFMIKAYDPDAFDGAFLVFRWPLMSVPDAKNAGRPTGSSDRPADLTQSPCAEVWHMGSNRRFIVPRGTAQEGGLVRWAERSREGLWRRGGVPNKDGSQAGWTSVTIPAKRMSAWPSSWTYSADLARMALVDAHGLPELTEPPYTLPSASDVDGLDAVYLGDFVVRLEMLLDRARTRQERLRGGDGEEEDEGE